MAWTRTVRWLKVTALVGAVTPTMSLTVAHAGDGTIRLVLNPDDTLDHGEIEASIYVDLPRTTEEYTEFEEQLRGANQLICDYTDGLFRLSELRLTHHPAERRSADILWFRRGDRARSSVGSFGQGTGSNPTAARGNLRIYGGERAEVIAHELGHLVFGVFDHYVDKRGSDGPVVASTNIDGPDTFTDPRTGAEFFRSLLHRHEADTPNELRESIVPGPVPLTTLGTPLYENGPSGEPWWLVNNSMMQQSSGQVCRSLSGMSPEQINPLIFADHGCASDADNDGDGVADDCEALALDQCTMGTVGAPCAINADCDTTVGAGDGLCQPVGGFPRCGVADINTSSEFTAPQSNDLNRFNLTTSIPTAVADAQPHVREARHLVVQGYLFPSSEGQPTTGTGGDRPCYDRDLNFVSSPDGICNEECNPGIVPGDPAWATQCTRSGRVTNSTCPFASLPGSPNNALCTAADNPLCNGTTLPVAAASSCDQCVVGNSESCTPMFGTFAMTGGASPFCGDGNVDTDPNPLPPDPALWRLVEQCDNGSAATGNAPDPSVPLTNPLTGAPLRCADIGDLLPTGTPDPAFVGGLVHCQPNCFLDLSRCTHAVLPTNFDPGMDGVLKLSEVRDQATATSFAEVFDSAGKIAKPADPALNPINGAQLNLREMGPSNHGVFLFFKRLARFRVNDPATGDAWSNPTSWANHRFHELWQLVIGMDEAEFGGSGFSGNLREVRRFELEFAVDLVANTSTLVAINGHSCTAPGTTCLSSDENEWPRVFLGFDTNPADDPYIGDAAGCQFPDGCPQPQPPTGRFQREECLWDGSCTVDPNPAAVTLRLDLRNLFVITAADELQRLITGQRGPVYAGRAGVVAAYARNNLVTISGLRKEVPQLGSTRYRMGQWNPVCETNPASPCCYHCDDPPNPVPAECRGGPGDRDWCQDQDRLAEFFELTGFNNELNRYDTARSTYGLLNRQVFGDGETPTYPAVTSPATAAEEDARRATVLGAPDQFIDSDWQILQQTMERRWGVTFDPARIPQGGSSTNPRFPGACPDPTILPRSPETVDVNEDLQIVFVLDRSGSMGVDDTLFGEEQRSRLDYVKNAARDFMDDLLAQVTRDGGARGPKVGLVWYSDEVEVRAPELTSTQCSEDSDCVTSQSCVARGGSQRSCTSDADCSGDDECINHVCARPNQSVCAEDLRFLATTGTATTIDVDDLKAQMVLSGAGVVEIPEPGGPDGGFTGSGAALEVAAHLFDPGRNVGGSVVPPTRIIVILSDGLHNRPKGGHCLGSEFCTQRDGSRCVVGTCGSSGTAPCPAEGARASDPGCWPTSAADERFANALDYADKQGILIYAVPLANDTDEAAMAVARGAVAGEVFRANRNFGEDAPPVFAQARAATRGEQLAHTHHALPYLQIIPQQEFGPVYYAVSEVQVEPGARTLDARISDYDARDETGFDADPISNTVFLVSPSGVSHSFFAFQSSPGISNEVSDLSATLRVDNPEPGTWRIEDRSPRVQGVQVYRRFYTSASIENPAFQCYAEASLAQTNGTQDITISAQAFFEGPIEQGATYSGTLLRPDLTIVNLDFTLDKNGMGRAIVRPGDFRGDGPYFVNVTCKVANGARVEAGENLPGYSGSRPATLIAPAFQRQVTASFSALGTGTVAVPGLGGNNQPQGELDELAEGVTCPSYAFCEIPATFAPVVPFLNDADGDGIANSDEPPATVDTDGDGRPDVYDADANGNEKPDGNDPCLDDSDPPSVSAGALTVESCTPAPRAVIATASASDACGQARLFGRLVSAAGKPVVPSLPVEANTEVSLPPGVSVIEWTATDERGNQTVTTQNVTVQIMQTAAACCPSGATVINGTDWFDFVLRPWPGSFCVFAKGAADSVKLGPGADFASGGSGNDLIDTDGAGDVIVGDTGHDVLKLLGFEGTGAVFGGEGDDWLELVADGVMHGNAGHDLIYGWSGRQEIIPGPGKDFVDAGFGDDIVRIQHVCEAAAFEVLNGGPGNDTLYTPVPLSQLNALGVLVSGFENVVVTMSNQHLSECFP